MTGNRKEIVERGKKLAIAIGLLIFLFWSGKPDFELDVLDVGQGDGCFLQTGSGYQIFVDGGSSDVKKVGEYRILPFLKYKGVRSIDYWFVSHTDTDHISGLLEVLAAGYKVGHLVLAREEQEGEVLSGTGDWQLSERKACVGEDARERDVALSNLLELAEQTGTEVLFVTQGDILHLGEARVQVLSPGLEENYADKNARSLVFLYEEGDFSGIFTGDIDAETEQKILAYLEKEHGFDYDERTGVLEEIDFYKVAHHGSKYSNSKEFLQALSPTIATISCGSANSYGHPHVETVERLREAESEIFYTMEGGQVTVRTRDRKIWGEKYLKE